MIPLVYLGCLLVGYYGPNVELIGGLRSDYWNYSPIEDVTQTVKFILMFFVVDLGSLFVSIALLWTFCRIN